MKATVLILVTIIAVVFAVDTAHAGCDCRQPAYKDQMDFVTRYMACLDDCLNANMQQINLGIESANRRISALETEIDRLNHKIKLLENGSKTDTVEK